METSRRTNPYLYFLTLILVCFPMLLKAQADMEIPVGVILDMGSWVGITVHSCITMAVSDFYAVNSHYKTRIVVHNRDTHGEPLHALSAALDLLEKPKVQAILGSQSTTEAKILGPLGDQARVPILSLSPILSSNRHPYFLQITQDETTQLQAIALMALSFGFKNAIVIFEDTDDGRNMATLMTSYFQEKSIVITYMSRISTSASNEVLQEELQKLSNMHTQLYIVHASHYLASRLFQNAKYLGMMDTGYKWIVTSKTMDFLDVMDDEVMESMQGVVGYKSYIPQSRDLHKFTLRLKKKYQAMDIKDINAYAISAYDGVSALAMALEKTHYVLNLNKKDLETTGSAQWGTTLLNHMLRISFDGLSGSVKFLNARVVTQVLEIVNVIDKKEVKVGFWTADAAFTKRIGRLNSFPNDHVLESIVWPGGILNNPTHRMLQVTGPRESKLRIGIPVKSRSGNFLQVDYDPQTRITLVSGFCFDVFKAALDRVNHTVSYEFIPFTNASIGQVNYNDLIYQVHLGNFDAAIGDITITANRSLYVDFTLPYTDLGVATLTRNEDATASLWIFMKPLSSDLWLISAGFFVLLGFVIWILEHGANDEFQGSLVQQIGITLWFAFSTLVYAHSCCHIFFLFCFMQFIYTTIVIRVITFTGRKLESNLSRFVVTVWLFVVLVLVSSYTAALSSILTVEQIQLASKRGLIGYQHGSPIQGLIVRNLNFKDTRLKPYDTLEDFADALSKGRKKGGVDAIVDEIPYIKEFLARYPSGYSMTVSEDITNGFGFAFPQRSPLAVEISRQIARLREDGTLQALDNKWFGQQPDPQSKDSAPGRKILNIKGLRGLFLISGNCPLPIHALLRPEENALLA